MGMKILIDHIEPNNEMTVLKEINKLASAKMIQFRTFHSEQPKVTFGSDSAESQKIQKGYVGGIKNKGVTGEELVLKTIESYGPVTQDEMASVFVEHKFAPNSARATLSKVKKYGKITRDIDGKYHLIPSNVSELKKGVVK